MLNSNPVVVSCARLWPHVRDNDLDLRLPMLQGPTAGRAAGRVPPAFISRLRIRLRHRLPRTPGSAERDIVTLFARWVSRRTPRSTGGYFLETHASGTISV